MPRIVFALFLFCSLSFASRLSYSQEKAMKESSPKEPPYTNVEEADQGNEPEVVEAPAENKNDFAQEEPVIEASSSRSTIIKKHHPFARKGLQKIDSDGVYYYSPTTLARKDQTTSVRFGSIQAPRINSVDGQTTYQGMYGTGSPVFAMFDYDWQPLQGYGKLGVQLGGGFFSTTGSGRFLYSDVASEYGTPKEKYTFYVLPLSLGGIYRLEWLKRQWFAPYISGGVSYFTLIEARNDGKTPRVIGTPNAYGAFGGMINVSAIDKEAGFALDTEYGISSLWITFEVRQIQSSNKDLDFSGTMLSMGFAADY